jgi:hypothetical protein
MTMCICCGAEISSAWITTRTIEEALWLRADDVAANINWLRVRRFLDLAPPQILGDVVALAVERARNNNKPQAAEPATTQKEKI